MSMPTLRPKYLYLYVGNLAGEFIKLGHESEHND
jgi:hypothetical protein